MSMDIDCDKKVNIYDIVTNIDFSFSVLPMSNINSRSFLKLSTLKIQFLNQNYSVIVKVFFTFCITKDERFNALCKDVTYTKEVI